MAGRHILLVEDDTDLLDVLMQVLQEQGYRVSAATRRAEALRVLGAGGIDLIVADSALRGGNGDDLAENAAQQGIPVIMMSGEPDRIARLHGGPAPFLAKPFYASDLVQLAADLLPD